MSQLWPIGTVYHIIRRLMQQEINHQHAVYQRLRRFSAFIEIILPRILKNDLNLFSITQFLLPSWNAIKQSLE